MQHAAAFAGHKAALSLKVAQPATDYNMVSWNKHLHHLYSLQNMSAEDYVKFLIMYQDETNMKPKATNQIPSGINMFNFQKSAIIPFVALHYGGVLNPRVKNNYAACQLISVPIAPLEAPANQLKFQYVIEKRELSLAQRGDARMPQGNTKSSSMVFDVGLVQYFHRLEVDYEALLRIDQQQVFREMEKLVQENVMAWQATIAMYHFVYANAQPSYSTVLLQIKSKRREYANRCRSGLVNDLVSIDNLITGCMNRSLDTFNSLIAAAVEMMPEIRQVVAIMPRHVFAEHPYMFTVRVTVNPAILKFSIHETDETYKKIDVDWSHNLVSEMANGDMPNRYSITPVSTPGADVPNIAYKTLQEPNQPGSFLLPALKVGEMTVPLILLDNEPLSNNGPSMESSFTSSGFKRYFFLVGAVPPVYRSLYNNAAFYKDQLDITTGTAAQKDPRVSSVINMEESAAPTDVELYTLHKQANVQSVFDLVGFTSRVDTLPEIVRPTAYLAELKNMFDTPTELRTTHKVSLYEFSPRIMRSLKYEPNAGQIGLSFKNQHRLCMWNAFQMSAPEGEYAALVSLLSYMGTQSDLDNFLCLVNGAAAIVTVESVSALVMARALCVLIKGRNDLEDMLDPAINQDAAAFSAALVTLINHVVSCKGNTLLMSDPICQIFISRLVPYLDSSCQFATRAGATAGQTAALALASEPCRARLREIHNVLSAGMCAFRGMVSKFPVECVPREVLPFSLSTYDLAGEDEEYVLHFSNFALPGLVNKELSYFWAQDGTLYPKKSDGPPDSKRKKTGEHSATPIASSVGNILKREIYKGRTLAFCLPNEVKTGTRSILDGARKNTGGGYTFDTEDRVYNYTFYCRSNRANLGEELTNAVGVSNLYNFASVVTHKHILDVANQGAQLVAVTDRQAGHGFVVLAFADVSHVRINMNFDTVGQDNRTGIMNGVEPFYNCLQPPLVLRLNQLRDILGNLPTHAFYMCMHYFTMLSRQNLIKRFDRNYYSSWAYMCIRTMRYTGHNMTVMPVGDSIFVTGNRTVYKVESNDRGETIGTEMDMAIMPGRQGSHGISFPSVFIKEMSGMNVVFLDREDRTSTHYTLGTNRANTDKENCILVLDWSNYLMPETTTACRTCPAVIPVSGRYINATTARNGMNGQPQRGMALSNLHLTEYDPLLKSYCVCPTLLPHISDSWMILEDMKLCMHTDKNPAELFCAHALYNSVEDSLPGNSLPKFEKADMLKNALLRKICVPFTDSLALMFADTYTIGRGGSQFLKSTNTEQKLKELTPRVEGEGLTPCHYFYREQSAHFASKFNKVVNLQLSPSIFQPASLALASVAGP
ncbi:ORF80 [Ranid herpesvirus 2]|uniref:ORF80 n=1 Tax=Ranid herpesvirus 2 TaxID=389214 RepID=Q14W26_9VIRU|nr:ORF80 [Ranid herpesvirus 2]ABG25572.1 ORF80 [Ranid herpesvirus 2]